MRLSLPASLLVMILTVTGFLQAERAKPSKSTPKDKGPSNRDGIHLVVHSSAEVKQILRTFLTQTYLPNTDSPR